MIQSFPRKIRGITASISFILLSFSALYAAPVAPNTDARRTWSELKTQNPRLDELGYFDDFVLQRLRTPKEASIREALDKNPILAALRPMIQQMAEREANFVINQFKKRGFRRLGPDVEPELYEAAVSAVARTGFGPKKAEDIYIFKGNSGGQANAVMFTGRSAGKLVMLLFDGNEGLFSTRMQHKSVAGHEATHYFADHSRTIMEIMLSMLITGEGIMEREHSEALAKISVKEKQIQDLQKRQEQAAKPATARKIGKQIEALTAEVRDEKAAAFKQLAENKERLGKSVGQNMYQKKLIWPSSEIDVPELIGLAGGKGSQTSFFAELRKELKTKIDSKILMESFADVMAILGQTPKEAKAIRDQIVKGQMTFDAFMKISEGNLDALVRSLEDTADRGGVLAAGAKASEQVDYLLSGGKRFREGDMNVDAWMKASAEASLDLKKDAAADQMVRESEGNHSFGPDRARLAAEFEGSPAFGTLSNYFTRLVDFYLQRRAEALFLQKELKLYQAGKPSIFTNADASLVSEQALIVENFVEPLLGKVEDQIVRLATVHGKGEGKEFLAEVAGKASTLPLTLTKSLVAKLDQEMRKAAEGGKNPFSGDLAALQAAVRKGKDIDPEPFIAKAKETLRLSPPVAEEIRVASPPSMPASGLSSGGGHVAQKRILAMARIKSASEQRPEIVQNAEVETVSRASNLLKVDAEVLKGITKSAGLFGIQSIGSDLVVIALTQDWDRLKSWATFKDLKHTLKSWGALTASGTLGDAFFKAGYSLYSGRTLSSLSTAGALTGRAAVAARTIPLWFALVGAELAETGSVSASTMTLGVPNVLAAHTGAMMLGTLYKQGVVQAIRVPIKMAQGESLAAFSATELAVLGIVEFTILRGLGAAEQKIIQKMQDEAMLGQVTDRIRQFHQVSFSDRVAPGFANKRVEWNSAFRSVVADLYAFDRRDELRLVSAKEAELEAVRKSAKGGVLSSPKPRNEILAAEYLIDQKYAQELARITKEKSKESRERSLSLPLPLSPTVAGQQGTSDAEEYRDRLDEAIRQGLSHPGKSVDTVRQVIDQTLEGMDRYWSFKEGEELDSSGERS